jgi:hypothetical protein
MLAASSQPILVPSGTRWTKKTGRPTGDVIDDANFLARVRQGQGIVTLTETEKAGIFSRRRLAEGVHICDGREYWVPVKDTEVEWSFPTVTSPTAHVEWTVSQILTYLKVLVPNDDQLRKCAET